MTGKKGAMPLTELSELLDQEREALLKGDLEKLGALLVPKEALIDALNVGPQPDSEAIRQLDRKVQRNQLLMDGALEGIRAVAARLAKLREVKGALETYGADGRKRDLPSPVESSVERRA